MKEGFTFIAKGFKILGPFYFKKVLVEMSAALHDVTLKCFGVGNYGRKLERRERPPVPGSLPHNSLHHAPLTTTLQYFWGLCCTFTFSKLYNLTFYWQHSMFSCTILIIHKYFSFPSRQRVALLVFSTLFRGGRNSSTIWSQPPCFALQKFLPCFHLI